MEIYKYTNLENGNILLKKIIIDTNNYIVENKESGDKLLKKIQNINISDLQNYNFLKSIILECLINNIKFDKLKYRPILEQIYKLINDGPKIIKKSTLNIKTIKKKDEGFYYLDNIGISVQGADSNKCLYEILNQCIENKINIKLQIKTFDNHIIILKNEK